MSAAAETGLFLDGLRCSGCAHSVERELRAAPGVVHAAVNYTTHRALVRFDPARTDAGALVNRVEGLGFRAAPYDLGALDRPAERAARDALVRVLVAAFLAGNVMMVSLALYLGADAGLEPALRRGLRWLAVTLSAPAVGWCALPFWRGALLGLRRGRLTIDVPIVLGVTTAFAASIAGTLADAPDLYFDSAAVIVFLILLGRSLERRARARASGAVERLSALAPPTALRRGPDGLREVPAAALRRGDRVVVAPGQAIPADGTIRAGATEMCEALLTGESQPVARAAGDAVATGARNVLCEIEIEVSAPPGEGTLARLSALLERAQAERPAIQRLADRVASGFAPAVVLLALAAALARALSGAPALEVALTAAAVCIVACPCALGLATPAAVSAALGRAAALGVLVRSGEAIERLAGVDAALLDKTGTLTQGRFAVDAVLTTIGVGRGELLAAAAAAEGASTHPIAEAIRDAAAAAGAVAPAVELERRSYPGRGVEARGGDGVLRVGSRALLAAAGVEIAPALRAEADALRARGLSVAWVARDARALGVLGLSDPPRPDARAAIARLRRLGLDVRLVTGDHAEAARLAAARCGIGRACVAAGVTPEGKLAQVRARRAGGARVLVVGDGLNDAAALAAADVGAAMPRGADVTLHAADLVIRTPQLGAVADAVELARSAMRRIRENLGFALLYNVAAIPLAAAGAIPPLAAAIAMSLSSLAVTANAIRLLRFRADR